MKGINCIQLLNLCEHCVESCIKTEAVCISLVTPLFKGGCTPQRQYCITLNLNRVLAILLIRVFICGAVFQDHHPVLHLPLCQHLSSHHRRNSSLYQNHTIRVLLASRHESTQWHSEDCTPSQRSPPLHLLLPILAHHRPLKGTPPPLL